MTKNDYIEKITQNLEHLTKDELKDVAILTNAQFGVRLKVAEKEYWGKEIANLKSQLQQQALPVVPEWLDIEIKHFKSTSKHPTVDVVFGVADAIVAVKNGNTHSKLYDYLFCGKQDVCNQHQDIFALAFITRKYEVEKPQLFYLKHIDMSKSDAHLNWYLAKGTDNVLIHQGIKKGKSPKLKCILKL
ncbi:DUF1642 domain-containing protein, partial [Lactococcus lactis]|uniref:DUF1642 domain-containing protein n=1 Tax=Lactococcus lactis TaxID=1358 RepID=UPI0027FFB846